MGETDSGMSDGDNAESPWNIDGDYFMVFLPLSVEVELGHGPEQLTQTFVLQPGRPIGGVR